MKDTDPTTKALQDIAAQLKRIADYLEHAPIGETINVTMHGGKGNEVIGRDGTNYNNSQVYSAHGDRPTAAKEVSSIDNTTSEGNTDSFNTNSDTSIKALADAVKTHVK